MEPVLFRRLSLAVSSSKGSVFFLVCSSAMPCLLLARALALLLGFDTSSPSFATLALSEIPFTKPLEDLTPSSLAPDLLLVLVLAASLTTSLLGLLAGLGGGLLLLTSWTVFSEDNLEDTVSPLGSCLGLDFALLLGVLLVGELGALDLEGELGTGLEGFSSRGAGTGSSLSITTERTEEEDVTVSSFLVLPLAGGGGSSFFEEGSAEPFIFPFSLTLTEESLLPGTSLSSSE